MHAAFYSAISVGTALIMLMLSWWHDPNALNFTHSSHYPGQMGGDAILHTLLNYEGAAPAGRLTTTVYPQEFTARPMSDMSLSNITYKHYLGTPVYPFGYGESTVPCACR